MLLRTLIVAAGAVLAAAGLRRAALRREIVEVGTAPEAAPACPASPCLAVSRTTGYQAKVADERSTFIVPADGKIVAWTIASASPTSARSRSSTSNFGEASRAA